MSLLLITHDLGVVKAMADRVCVMYAGQVVEQATVREFFSQVKHPYSQQLLAALPSFNKRHYRLQTIPGAVPTLDCLPNGCRFHPRCAHAFGPCDDQEPQLQTIQNRIVRCHLYPDLDKPPALASEERNWEPKPNQRTEETLLRVNELSVHFYTKRGILRHNKEVIKAVDGLSFELYKGRTLALVGESGCGKTTVSRAVLRLQPVTVGEISYRDKNINRAMQLTTPTTICSIRRHECLPQKCGRTYGSFSN